jgi:hypothetical protein
MLFFFFLHIEDAVECNDSCEWAMDGICDDGSISRDLSLHDDDYGGFYGYYGYYSDDGDDGYYSDDGYLAPVCPQGTDCTDCGGTVVIPPVVCDNSCQWSNDGFCDDTRTSGLCNLGTDCHDCGPVGASNFTTWDDDGWWDDDDNYWEIDDTFSHHNDDDGEHHAGKLSSSEEGSTLAGFGLFGIMASLLVLVGIVFFSVKLYLNRNTTNAAQQSVPATMTKSDDVDDTLTKVDKKSEKVIDVPEIVISKVTKEVV